MYLLIISTPCNWGGRVGGCVSPSSELPAFSLKYLVICFCPLPLPILCRFKGRFDVNIPQGCEWSTAGAFVPMGSCPRTSKEQQIRHSFFLSPESFKEVTWFCVPDLEFRTAYSAIPTVRSRELVSLTYYRDCCNCCVSLLYNYYGANAAFSQAR